MVLSLVHIKHISFLRNVLKASSLLGCWLEWTYLSCAIKLAGTHSRESVSLAGDSEVTWGESESFGVNRGLMQRLVLPVHLCLLVVGSRLSLGQLLLLLELLGEFQILLGVLFKLDNLLCVRELLIVRLNFRVVRHLVN